MERFNTLALTLCLCTAMVRLGQPVAALPKCEKIDDCSCKTPDGKVINIEPLGNRGGKTPRFGYEAVFGETWKYAYNPCYPFSDGGGCTDAVACQMDVNDQTLKFNIGTKSATWLSDDDTSYTIQYSHTDSEQTLRTSSVTLVCDANQETPKLERLGYLGSLTNYFFILTSKCACPDGCPVGGISVGSVLCIIVTVLFVVYALVGVLFMKFVRHAEGREVIPNYEIWMGLIGYIKEGFVFVTSCGKRTSYNAIE